MSMDPSKGKDSKVGDYSAFTVLAVDSHFNLWVDADIDRRNTTVIVDDCLRLYRQWQEEIARPIAGLVVESNGFQELFVGQLMKRTSELGMHPPAIFARENLIPKIVRIRRLTPILTQGRIRIRNTKGRPNARSPVARFSRWRF